MSFNSDNLQVTKAFIALYKNFQALLQYFKFARSFHCRIPFHLPPERAFHCFHARAPTSRF